MKQEIQKQLKKLQCVSLAPCEGNNPRVCPMSLILVQDRWFFSTSAIDHKTSERQPIPLANLCSSSPTEGIPDTSEAAG